MPQDIWKRRSKIGAAAQNFGLSGCQQRFRRCPPCNSGLQGTVGFWAVGFAVGCIKFLAVEASATSVHPRRFASTLVSVQLALSPPRCSTLPAAVRRPVPSCRCTPFAGTCSSAFAPDDFLQRHHSSPPARLVGSGLVMGAFDAALHSRREKRREASGPELRCRPPSGVRVQRCLRSRGGSVESGGCLTRRAARATMSDGLRGLLAAGQHH